MSRSAEAGKGYFMPRVVGRHSGGVLKRKPGRGAPRLERGVMRGRKSGAGGRQGRQSGVVG